MPFPVIYGILFHPRSGSTWLSSLLAANAHFYHGYELLDRNVACRDKFITEEERDRFDDDMQFTVIERFIQHVEAYPRIQAAGFKFAPYQLIGAASMMSRLQPRPIKIISLQRKDLLAAAVSQIGARKLEAAGYDANWKKAERASTIIRLERDQLIYFMTEQKLERDRVESISGVCEQGSIIKITYEELLADPQRIVDRLSDYLGVEIKFNSHVGVYKHLSTNLRDSVENLDEALGWLKGTVFEQDIECHLKDSPSLQAC